MDDEDNITTTWLIVNINSLDSSWTGYKTLTCYFVNHRVNASNEYEYDVVFHGILSDDNAVKDNKAPFAKIKEIADVKEKEVINFSSGESYDEDGEIVSYLWDFGDNETSNEENPSHIYQNSGKYTVKLTVTDNKNVSSSYSIDLVVKKEPEKPTVEGISEEKEQNDDFATANNIEVNTLVNCSFDESDSCDVFSFDVASKGSFEIVINTDEGCGINWLLYKATDLNNYIGFPKTRGAELKESEVLEEGKYYIRIYKYSGSSGNYKVKVNSLTNKS
ncbi:PKD domain-containing protein [Haloimpatiens sp. FM7315]|uniref:PKD domain-containing protein n=1 Tax=Haloimpatiens sp. FM7315 TaxID=3298609 RepID=UPI003977C7A2